MSETPKETPQLIDHVPTAEELAASQPNEATMNFNDPAQLAQFNAAREALGHAPVAAPGPKAEIAVVPSATDAGPTGEPLTDIERPVSREELVKLREQIAREAGRTALRGEQ